MVSHQHLLNLVMTMLIFVILKIFIHICIVEAAMLNNEMILWSWQACVHCMRLISKFISQNSSRSNVWNVNIEWQVNSGW